MVSDFFDDRGKILLKPIAVKWLGPEASGQAFVKDNAFQTKSLAGIQHPGWNEGHGSNSCLVHRFEDGRFIYVVPSHKRKG